MLLPPSVLTLFENAYKRNAITMYKVTGCLLMKRSKYQNLNLCWKFVLDNDNYFELLDKKKEVVWPRRDTIEFLHRKLLAEAMVVSPGYLVKPKAEDWGTGLCKIYKYPELKSEFRVAPVVIWCSVEKLGWSAKRSINNVQRLAEQVSQTKQPWLIVLKRM